MFRSKVVLGMVTGIIICLIFTGSSKTGKVDGSADKKLTIYTTIYPIYDFTKKLAGDRDKVVSILPPGAEPHSYEPTPREMAALNKADLLI
ncbi:substrate-binding protein of zinc uptake complex component A [Scopulibacillus darangshiensis]|uniref:Substrate-binding protein of zinc uptake complex component A n=1 Tax=Scopulibacillus darangshiensis TaxID=442528 RepID=A0A4R2P4Y0_9BACL|nr:zinc ABC transporter substrate-binding protein [Scopulibacillus darangshiensis]TCP29717.1 substrate-binding protein of zinc uptake complex component A [Scopulibacillus darangshiensis]